MKVILRLKVVLGWKDSIENLVLPWKDLFEID